MIEPTGRSPWFETAFGPLYSEIYQHRDEDEAERAVAMLLARGSLAPPVLDIGCGTGRHLVALEKGGVAGVGLDLSSHLLEEAATRAAGVLVRGDMRQLPFADASFGSALSMFTTFGYFADAAENRRVLKEAARVVRPGGGLAIDYFNAVRTVADLAPESTRFVGRYDVIERRTVARDERGERLVKTIDVFEGSRLVDQLREEVRIYQPAELDEAIRSAGWTDLVHLGDYQGHDFDPGTSPRLIILARRSA
jgi:SAM-dependent methyltransferase